MAQPIVGRRLKRIKRLFPNHLVRHLPLRLVARHFPRAKLAVELEDYLAHTPATENLEVAGYAALAGLPTERVRQLAGTVILPPRKAREDARAASLGVDLDGFSWSALVLGFEDEPAAINRHSTAFAAPPQFLKW
jgi:hypothetical protein